MLLTTWVLMRGKAEDETAGWIRCLPPKHEDHRRILSTRVKAGVSRVARLQAQTSGDSIPEASQPAKEFGVQ